MHLYLGYNIDHIYGYLLNLALRGLSRLNPWTVKRAEPMTLEILLRIFVILDFSNSENIVYWCLFLFAFFLCARKSNLVPTSSSDIDSGKFLSTESIQFYKNYILVHFNRSKTIQFGEREIITPLLRLEDKRLCPVAAYERLLVLKLKHYRHVFFTLPNDSVITYYLFQKKLRKCITEIGLDADKFSTHSFRRGFTTLAHRMDIPHSHIQILGDWKSDAYKAYLELNWSDKVAILSKMFRIVK